MKPLNLNPGQRLLCVVLLLTVLQLSISRRAIAQLPDCSSGTTGYVVFNDSLGSGVNSPSEIRPVNLTTGALGPLVGGTTYLISKTSSGNTYYGTSALGVDLITNRYYVMTQMGASIPKDIITINPVGPTQTVIGTTPASLNSYHFVKLAMHPTNGFGYAIGVVRDTSLSWVTPNNINPIIRFSTCGAAPSAGCATASIITLGYLPTLPGMFRWELFNGDIAFDLAGNLYFASAGFRRVNSRARYTDARLFRINAGDIPAVAGTGIIPMTLLADYDGLDSTVINGIALNAGGAMYLTTRRFNGVQATTPPPTFNNELYNSFVPGTSNLMPGFGPITVGYSVADMASCYFPLTVLPEDKLDLSGKYISGYSSLSWKANNNKNVRRFEIQRSEGNTNNFTTIATIDPINPDKSSQIYEYKDAQSGFGRNVFYRIREVMHDGKGIYSNVLKISFNQKFNLINRPKPNPFFNTIELNIQLQTANQVNVRLIDESGRIALQQRYNGQRGENMINVNGLNHLKAGIYVLEISADGEIVREKLVKQ